MKISGKAPEWAIELFQQACKDYNRGLPSLITWRNMNRDGSSGWTRSRWYKKRIATKTGAKYIQWYGEVSIRAGKNEVDQKLVLLHELAHHIVGRSKAGRGQGHTKKFWKLAFELYDRYGVDLNYAIKREENYKVMASTAYAEHIAAKETA